jgi:hypothetical protein
MDILAHGLWVGAGAVWLRRRGRITTRTLWYALAFAVAPDAIQVLPVAAWALASGAPASLWAYVAASPGMEPPLPAAVALAAHHLHCMMHSIVIAGAVTAVAWLLRGRFPVALLGWWAHIALDVPTHSSEYYAVPVLYPFTYAGVDGIAWTAPWFLALNYALLAAAYAWLFATRGGRAPRRG